jgi:hypothetical protein
MTRYPRQLGLLVTICLACGSAACASQDPVGPGTSAVRLRRDESIPPPAENGAGFGSGSRTNVVPAAPAVDGNGRLNTETSAGRFDNGGAIGAGGRIDPDSAKSNQLLSNENNEVPTGTPAMTLENGGVIGSGG